MQAVEQVLHELHGALDARILGCTEALDRDTKILAFLRRCVAEEVQCMHYNSKTVPHPTEESIVHANLFDSAQSDSKDQFARSTAKPTVLKFDSFDGVEKGSSPRNGGGDASNRRSDSIRAPEESYDTASATASRITAIAEKSAPASLEDILQHARQLRLAHEKLAPGADGSRLGGSAGRNSASSHSSARGGSVSNRSSPASAVAARGAKPAANKTARAVPQAAGAKVNARPSEAKSYGMGEQARSAAAQPKDNVAPAHRRPASTSAKEARDEDPPSGAAIAPRSLPAMPSNAFMHCLVAQLELLSLPTSRKYWEPKHTLKDTASAAVPSTELLESQAALLSQLTGYPTLPPSIAFECLKDIRLRDGKGKTPPIRAEEKDAWLDDNEDAEAARARRDCYAAANASRSARDEYQKHWRLRLERAPMSSLGLKERQQVISIWYRLHICSQVFEDAQRRLRSVRGGRAHASAPDSESARSDSSHVFKQEIPTSGGGGGGRLGKDKAPASDPDVVKINALLHDLVLSFPAAAQSANVSSPNSHSHGQGSALLSRAQSERERKRGPTPAPMNAQLQAQTRADFHEALKSRVQYVVEAAVGGFLVRDVVRQLRQCCEHSTPLAEKGTSICLDSDTTLQQWQDALRSYRALHTCLLTDGASDPASCMFMRKD